MINSIKLERLVERGIQAPSGHNTQPWRFVLRDDEIQIHPDFKRAMPVVDSDHHELYISLGCAAENIVIAATAMGLHAKVKMRRSKATNGFISIALEPDERTEVDELVNYIDERQTTRNKYKPDSVPVCEVKKLKASFDFRGIEMMIFLGNEEIEALKPFVLEASRQQFKNAKFVNELVQWMRFSDKKAMANGDGLRAQCLGLPNMPPLIGKTVMNYMVTANSEAKRWSKLLDASAGLVLFTVAHNNISHWVRLGRAFERFALTATKLGISHSHVNMPCENEEVRKNLAHRLNLCGLTPLLLIRFGYSEPMPYSMRRELEEVIER